MPCAADLLKEREASYGENVEHLLPGSGTEGTAAQGLRVPARHVQGPAEAALPRALHVRRAQRVLRRARIPRA